MLAISTSRLRRCWINSRRRAPVAVFTGGALLYGAVLSSNRVHIDQAIAKVLASGKRRIGMIGLSFKTGTDDLRESPLVLVAEQLIVKGLGFRKLNSVREAEDTASIRGMVAKVPHLLRIMEQ